MVISAHKFHILNVNVYKNLILTVKFHFSTNRSTIMQTKHKAPIELTKCAKTVRYNTRSLSGFGGLEVACWPLVPKSAGSNPAEAVGFFRAKKYLSTPSFGREVKPFVLCRRFTACKRSLNVTWKSGIFRQNSSAIYRPSSSSFHY